MATMVEVHWHPARRDVRYRCHDCSALRPGATFAEARRHLDSYHGHRVVMHAHTSTLLVPVLAATS